MKKKKVDVYLAIGWLIVVFDPELFGFWREDKKNGYFITKLKTHRCKLDNYLPTEDIIKLKEAIDDFIKKNEEFRKKPIFLKYFFRSKMKEKAKEVFKNAHQLLK